MESFEITKSQLINEISVIKGQMHGSATNDFFNDIQDYSKPSKIINLIRKYFDRVVGYSIDDFSKSKINDYLNELGFSYPDFKKLPKILKNRDVISNLAYYLASNLLKMKDGIGVKYVKYNDTYYFFDSELEELFGCIRLTENEFEGVKKYCKTNSVYQVSVSMSDKELRGTGIGKNMYLTLINKFGCLISDSILYESALNIWVNVLPKYSNVYYYDENDEYGKEIKPLKTPPKDMTNTKYFLSVKR